MKYLKMMLKDKFCIKGTSVNLDPIAVDKVNAFGGNAVLCRAEEYESEIPVDFYLSYEMVEHLHNPALFFYKLAKSNKSKYMIITVPYLKRSRVGLYRNSDKSGEKFTAEQEHIFELSPHDWEKLIFHSGWKVIQSEVYFQYPRHIPILSKCLKAIWRSADYEGFLGLALQRDMSVADRYMDWEA